MDINTQLNSTIKSKYKVIPRTLSFITNNKKTLLLKNSPHKTLWPNLYNGVGGHIKQGEGIKKSALREITEETGLSRIENLQIRGVIHIDTTNDGIVLYVFTATTNTTQLKDSKEGKPDWVDWKTLDMNQMVPDLPILLDKLQKCRPGDPVFIAHYRLNPPDMLEIIFE